MKPNEVPFRVALFIVLATAAALISIRFLGKPDLMENDQQAPAAYVLDVVCNGHWIVQHDDAGAICSKPPMYVWLAAAGMKLSGQINTFWLYLPNALALTGVACLLLFWGNSMFGWRCGLFAALMFLLCHMGAKHVALARTDAMFATMVTLGAWLAFQAWARGWSWTWFWLACAAATLTKGPLGALLAASGLLALLWGRDTRQGGHGRKGHLLGLLLLALICGGWWWLASREVGGALADKMIKSELVGHVLHGDQSKKWYAWFSPIGYFFGRFFPWFLLTVAEIWRLIRQPSTDPAKRFLERFLVCWMATGTIIFGAASAQRPDYVIPLLPAAALLAAMALSRWLAAINPRRLLAATVAVALIVLAGFFAYYNRSRPHPELLQQTQSVIELAEKWRQISGDRPVLVHVDSPFAFQFYLHTMQQKVPVTEAARLLKESTPTFVAVCDYAALREQLKGQVELVEVAAWPVSGEKFIRIVGNRPVTEAAK